jgi:regulation of enolase protein 1 (concanavalin A-like superfamily)
MKGERKMPKAERGKYEKKHSPERKLNPEVAKAVMERSKESALSCAAAFRLADDLQVSPEEVGFAMDFHNISITRCQLGLFGYGEKKKVVKPAEVVSDELKVSIQEGLVNDRLPCAVSWRIAEHFHVGKMAVSSACESLKVKISPCQLGAF